MIPNYITGVQRNAKWYKRMRVGKLHHTITPTTCPSHAAPSACPTSWTHPTTTHPTTLRPLTPWQCWQLSLWSAIILSTGAVSNHGSSDTTHVPIAEACRGPLPYSQSASQRPLPTPAPQSKAPESRTKTAQALCCSMHMLSLLSVTGTAARQSQPSWATPSSTLYASS